MISGRCVKDNTNYYTCRIVRKRQDVKVKLEAEKQKKADR